MAERSRQPKHHRGPDSWVARPDVDDGTVSAATGRGWEEWVALIDSGPGREASHTAIATWLRERHRIDGWWAQGVTVGYERIIGRRLPGQRADGTFTVSRSRTLPGDIAAARALLLDDAARAEFFPTLHTTLRSRPSAKQLRFAVVDDESGAEAGQIGISLDPAPSGVKLVVTHEKLDSPEAAERWKDFWGTWISGVELP